MKAYSNDFRQKIVESNRRDFESIQQTAARFHVSYSFVWKLIKGYEQTGLVSPKPHGGGAKPKLNSSQLGVVAQLIEQKNDATLEELAIQLEETIGVRVSRATMGRVMLKLKLTRKKTLHATERETERVQQLRVQYWHEIGEQVCRTEASVPATLRQVKLEDLVFVDETGSNLAMTRRYARSCRGSRAYNHARVRTRTESNINRCYCTKRTGRGKNYSWRNRCPSL